MEPEVVVVVVVCDCGSSTACTLKVEKQVARSTG